jgi:hypothetical protein
MIRTVNEAIGAYLNAAEMDKVRMLIRLSYDLTITARDLASSADTKKTARLPGVFEIQHLALSQALGTLSGSVHRYPDEDMIPVLIKTASRFSLSNHVEESISKFLAQLPGSADAVAEA